MIPIVQPSKTVSLSAAVVPAGPLPLSEACVREVLGEMDLEAPTAGYFVPDQEDGSVDPLQSGSSQSGEYSDAAEISPPPEPQVLRRSARLSPPNAAVLHVDANAGEQEQAPPPPPELLAFSWRSATPSAVSSSPGPNADRSAESSPTLVTAVSPSPPPASVSGGSLAATQADNLRAGNIAVTLPPGSFGFRFRQGADGYLEGYYWPQ